MANNWFQFKQFKIIQENSGMKVGTDGVLLGSYFHAKHDSQILDIGAGTGLLSLMMVQRFNCTVDAVEIDENAANDCKFNFHSSPWGDKLKLHIESIQSFFKKFLLNDLPKYDFIISNPPFFSNSLKSDDPSRNLSRHDDSLAFKELFFIAQRMLSDTGSFGLIIPADRADEVRSISKNLNLYLLRELKVFPSVNKSHNRVIFEFSKVNSDPIFEELTVYENGKPSEKYKALTEAFYL